MNEYDNLKELTVYQLRTLARSVGVHAPTTKTVDVLINEIIDIRKGKLEPKKSKMGRPPKNQGALTNSFNVKEAKSISDLGYEPIINYTSFVLESPDEVEGISVESYNFFGVVRQQNAEMFVKNYNDNFDYVVLNSQNANFEKGDIVFGKAEKYKQNFGKSIECYKYDCKNLTNSSHQLSVKVCKDINCMYDYINTQNGNNFVVEVESSRKFVNNVNNICFYTKECEDIIKSYNMLLDVKNMVKNLTIQKKSFTLNIVDIDYIYSILTMYYSYKKEAADINAGQYFKEILSMINDCETASVIIYQKENGIKSDYLNIILNKYCTFI